MKSHSSNNKRTTFYFILLTILFRIGVLIIENVKKSTKDKILELLKKDVSLSVNDLTERLYITHMAVRKHLNILEKDHLIKSIEVKQQMGRPLQLYSLTDKGERLFPKNYEGLTVDFLHDIKEIHGENSIKQLFKKREQRLINEYSPRIVHEHTPSEKIKEIVNIQNEKGYMANVTKIDENTFELIEYNCPILAVAKEFKIACQCETEMLKDVLQTKQVNRICCKTDGDDHCRFFIRF
ncbi:transcriptional regulator [Metabacillus sediminilitoris]|uniref:Transcriptional regulator n=1 Tax=Metabacillus sediminilitoris TaxID=2567941 RepID=A0A4S4BVQ8_9BACI|nr:DeoR family transcriptional regulator [Metabacillus sediminilitoris]THF79232.1 transcriptional regulator [Metabacillus sediminilitoris]